MSEEKALNIEELSHLFGQVVEVLAYNIQECRLTWEPMIFAELGPTIYNQTRVKFVPRRTSAAFPDDHIYFWSVETLLKRVRKIEGQV